jgi:hypothetical protein
LLVDLISLQRRRLPMKIRHVSLSTAPSLIVLLAAFALAGCSIAQMLGLTPPAAPLGLSASWAKGSSTEIDVSWSASNGATSYTLSRSLVGSSGPFKTAYNGAAVSFSDTGLDATSNYWYEVVATNGAGSSAASEIVEVASQSSTSTTYTLTITAGSGGTVSPSGAQTVTSGTATNISATANSGYAFVNWTQTAGSGTATFASATTASTTVTLTGGDATIQANFQLSYTLTIAAGSGGTVSPSGAQTVTSGVATNIAATASSGYTFVNWTQTAGSGTATFASATTASTTVTLTGGNATIQANFAVTVTLPQATLATAPVLNALDVLETDSADWSGNSYASSDGTLTATKSGSGTMSITINFNSYDDSSSGYTVTGTIYITYIQDTSITISTTSNLSLSGAGPVVTEGWSSVILTYSSSSGLYTATSGTITCNGTGFSAQTMGLTFRDMGSLTITVD